MRITFYGAAGSVTGSMHLVEFDGRRILLDCGLHQGRRSESDALNRDPGLDAASVDSIVLSHAHIDHSGSIPAFVRRGFVGSIHSTSATRDLCALMLADSARIQEGDLQFLNKKRRARNEPELEPVYTPADAAKAMQFFHTSPYYSPIEVSPGITARFIEAGHILGSAQIELTLTMGGRRTVLLYSGDLGRPAMPILRDPDTGASRPDILLMESTYGARRHESGGDAVKKLRNTIRETAANGGRVIIPAFSVGRTQEILYYLRLLRENGSVPRVPVFVDSPMAIDATAIFRLHPECFDEEALEAVQGGESPFSFDGLHFLQSVSESRALNDMKGSCIVISASGMCEHGRILHHLRHGVTNPANTILIVGFMARNTLGRAIADGARTVKIFGEKRDMKASVVTIDGFSAHADSEGLFEYASAAGASASRIVLVHGEEEQSGALSERLGGAGFACTVPSRTETLVVDAGD